MDLAEKNFENVFGKRSNGPFAEGLFHEIVLLEGSNMIDIIIMIPTPTQRASAVTEPNLQGFRKRPYLPKYCMYRERLQNMLILKILAYSRELFECLYVFPFGMSVIRP